MVTTPVHSIANCRPTGRVAGASNEVHRSALSGAAVRFDPGPPTHQRVASSVAERESRGTSVDAPGPSRCPIPSSVERRASARPGGFE